MKYKKYSKVLLLMMILPWLSIPFLGKGKLNRLLPSGIFISFVVLVVNFIAKRRRWWRWYDTFSPKVTWVIPFTWGPFIVGSMWILSWTYGNFFRYMLLNLIVDGVFTYGLTYYLRKFRIFSLVRLKKIQLMCLFMIDSLILYGLHFLNEKVLLRRG